MKRPLTPTKRTTIKGEGSVVHHDETRFGLRRMCVASYEKYPDLDVWCALLPQQRLLAHRYVDRMTSGVFIGYLWIYYKEGEV